MSKELEIPEPCSLCKHHSDEGYETECGECCHFYGDHFEAEE